MKTLGWIGLAVGFVGLFVWQSQICDQHQSVVWKLFGHKTVSALDMWSMQHFCTGIVLGFFLMAKKRMRWGKFILLILYVNFFWEAFELWAEGGYCGTEIASWKDGIEHWSNRFFADPILVTIGGIVYRKTRSKKLFLASSLIVTIWVIVNVLSPTAMSVQQFFGL